MHALKKKKRKNQNNKGVGKQVPRKVDSVQGREVVDSKKVNSGPELPNLIPSLTPSCSLAV